MSEQKGDSGSLRDYVTPLTREIMNALTGELIAVWDKVSETERATVARVSRRVAEMQLAKLSGHHWEESEWLHCKAQIANIKAVGIERGKSALVRAAQRGVQMLLAVIR